MLSCSECRLQLFQSFTATLFLFFFFSSFLSDFVLPIKGVNSFQSGEICSVAFDTTEGSNVRDGMSCKLPVSPEVMDDSSEHQKEPNQSQLDGKPQSSPAGVEEELTQTERQVPDADAADETGEDCNEEKKKGAEDIFTGSQKIPGDSQDVLVAEREEHEALRAEVEAVEQQAKEETEQTKADVEAEAQILEEAKLTDEDIKEGNADRSRSAEADSKFAESKHPESFVSLKKDHIWKRECRSLRHLKVLQTAAVAFL